MKSKAKPQIYDLTAIINEEIMVYPGDPSYYSEEVSSIKHGAYFNLRHLHLGNHTGTHIDFPAHVIEGGKTSSDYTISSFIGAGLIIEVPAEFQSISKSFIEQQAISKNDIVFFKTTNSNLSKHEGFKEKYVFIEPEAAEALLKKEVNIVGIDYISVDQYEAESLPVHHTLLAHDVLIVEGLELNSSPTGRCKIFILPLNIQNMDGLPARVIAEFIR